MLCAMAVIAVPASPDCLSPGPRWGFAPARGDIGVSDPRAFSQGAEECLLADLGLVSSPPRGSTEQAVAGTGRVRRQSARSAVLGLSGSCDHSLLALFVLCPS